VNSKVPRLLTARHPERAVRWHQALSFEAMEHTYGHGVSAAHCRIAARTEKATGYRIAFFSDLHASSLQKDTPLIQEAGEIIREFKPDCLICGGDVTTYAQNLEETQKCLSLFPDAPLKLAVPGNWERDKIWLNCAFWRKFFSDAGFRLLINEACVTDRVAFFGIDDPKSGNARGNIELPQEKETIVLAHNPDTVVHFDFAGLFDEIDLVLCGHTHAGQIRLPFFGAPITSSLYHRFDAGLFLHERTQTKMLISAGLGVASFPFRFRCHPEVILLTFDPPVPGKKKC